MDYEPEGVNTDYEEIAKGEWIKRNMNIQNYFKVGWNKFQIKSTWKRNYDRFSRGRRIHKHTPKWNIKEMYPLWVGTSKWVWEIK